MVGKVAIKLTRAEQKARRPQEILDAAFEVFVEKGYSAARIEDVAARLGVTKGTVYLYFPTKDALFEAVTRHTSSAFVDLRASIDTLSGSCADRLRSVLLLAYDKVAHDRKLGEMLRLALAEGPRFPEIIDRHYDEFIAPLLDSVRSLVDQGVAAGEFRLRTAEGVPDVIVGPLIHFILQELMFAGRKPLDETAIIEAHIDLVLNGLLR